MHEPEDSFSTELCLLILNKMPAWHRALGECRDRRELAAKDDPSHQTKAPPAYKTKC